MLAYAGIAFIPVFVLDKMFAFIKGFTPEGGANATPDIASCVEAILGLYPGFFGHGVPGAHRGDAAGAFQLGHHQLDHFRGYFIVVAFVVAAVG